MLLQKLLDEKNDNGEDGQPMTGSDEKKAKSPRRGSGKKRGSPCQKEKGSPGCHSSGAQP
jgi:hypothetical protein